MEKKLKYMKEGFAGGAVTAIVTLIVGIGIAVLLLIFVGSLGGQTYNLVEADITAITNETIENSIRSSIISGFKSLEQTGSYMPIIVLAVVITLVMALVLSLGGIGGINRGGGSAL